MSDLIELTFNNGSLLFSNSRYIQPHCDLGLSCCCLLSPPPLPPHLPLLPLCQMQYVPRVSGGLIWEGCMGMVGSKTDRCLSVGATNGETSSQVKYKR